jgi:hypothetical protein
VKPRRSPTLSDYAKLSHQIAAQFSRTTPYTADELLPVAWYLIHRVGDDPEELRAALDATTFAARTAHVPPTDAARTLFPLDHPIPPKTSGFRARILDWWWLPAATVVLIGIAVVAGRGCGS